jgi:hypothetical protein
MPKRSINLFNDHDENENYKITELFTQDEIMNCPEVADFIIDSHHTNFIIKLEDRICGLVDFLGRYNSAPNFLPEHQELGLEFVDLIYKYINKEYDFELLDLNPKLAHPLFLENKKDNKKKPVVIDKVIVKKQIKKFDWGTKTYK